MFLILVTDACLPCKCGAIVWFGFGISGFLGDRYKKGGCLQGNLPVSCWSQRDSNPPPTDCEPVALPDELWPQILLTTYTHEAKLSTIEATGDALKSVRFAAQLLSDMRPPMLIGITAVVCPLLRAGCNPHMVCLDDKDLLGRGLRALQN